jgi:Flp pilus assembly protein TadG
MNTAGLRRPLRLFTRLARDCRGVSAIEFAIAAPFVFIIVLGTVEIAVDMMMDASVQIAAQAASRSGLTTTNPATGTRASQAQAIAMSMLSAWSNVPHTSVSITETDYASYGDIGTAASTPGLGQLGDVVSYNISLTTEGVSGIPRLIGMGKMTFQRNYIVQNEK